MQQAVAEQPENSPAFARVARKTVLHIIGEAMKDIAQGHLNEAVRRIGELGQDLGPVITDTAAYAFFQNRPG